MFSDQEKEGVYRLQPLLTWCRCCACTDERFLLLCCRSCHRVFRYELGVESISAISLSPADAPLPHSKSEKEIAEEKIDELRRAQFGKKDEIERKERRDEVIYQMEERVGEKKEKL